MAELSAWQAKTAYTLYGSTVASALIHVLMVLQEGSDRQGLRGALDQLIFVTGQTKLSGKERAVVSDLLLLESDGVRLVDVWRGAHGHDRWLEMASFDQQELEALLGRAKELSLS